MFEKEEPKVKFVSKGGKETDNENDLTKYY